MISNAVLPFYGMEDEKTWVFHVLFSDVLFNKPVLFSLTFS